MKKNTWKEGEKDEIMKTIFSIGDDFQELFEEILDFHTWKSGEEIKDKDALCNKMLLVTRLSLARHWIYEKDDDSFSGKYEEIKNLIYACETGDEPLYGWGISEKGNFLYKNRIVTI